MGSQNTDVIRAALTAAVATGVGGFGVMCVLAATAPTSLRSLPDLWSYRSATWGDGLLLPLSCGALVFARRNLPGGGSRGVTATMAVAGGLGGLATQVFWLLDDSPRLNWTLPEPHRFNAAGVYHGVYLVIMSSIFAGLWASIISRIRASVRAGDAVSWPLVGGGIGLALGAGAGFAALVIADNQISAGSSSSASTLVTIGAALLGTFGVGALLARSIWQRSRSRRQ